MKKMMCLLILCFLLMACQKDEKYVGSHQIEKIRESLYPLVFNPGSYWIYENSENGTLDSLVLFDIVIDTTPARNIGKGYSQSWQFYNLTYSSQIFDDYTDIYIGYAIRRSLEYYTYNSYVYLSSFKIGESGSNATIAAIYDSLIVQNKVFRNVVKMEIYQDINIEDDMNLYYCDSVGVIKKEIKEEGSIIETWNLLRHHTSLYEVE